jgi:hypothetical protein
VRRAGTALRCGNQLSMINKGARQVLVLNKIPM